EPIVELTLVDTSGAIVASSADKPSAVALPPTWPTAVDATGAVVMPPHWDDARTAPTLTVAVPVLSLRNEVLGALSGVLDLRGVGPRLRNSVGAAQAEVVLLAPDGTPLLSTKSPGTSLDRIDTVDLARLRGESEPSAFVDFRRQESIGIAATPAGLPFIV